MQKLRPTCERDSLHLQLLLFSISTIPLVPHTDMHGNRKRSTQHPLKAHLALQQYYTEKQQINRQTGKTNKNAKKKN